MGIKAVGDIIRILRHAKANKKKEDSIGIEDIGEEGMVNAEADTHSWKNERIRVKREVDDSVPSTKSHTSEYDNEDRDRDKDEDCKPDHKKGIQDEVMEYKYKCALCKKSFCDQTDVFRHRKSVHDIAKEYRCDKCSYTAGRMIILFKHMRRNHMDDNQ